MKDLDLIYVTARGLPPEDRPAYLTKACGDDRGLRTRVEQMLAVADEAEEFIADLPDDDSEGRTPGREPVKNRGHEIDEFVGTTVGRYKLLERIGEGGWGVVYVAEQTEPVRRRVALKVIKLGMDTRQVVARFEAERQALAMMDHPNIAKIFDAGATDSPVDLSSPESGESKIQNPKSKIPSGRPYFAMELVRGIRITDYCNHANLSTKDRLDLFIQVCQAVQHAHQKGIIHRDIKPSNILIQVQDGVPVPKVIDFGIAKATGGRLTDATLYTQLHQFIGTPAYMSPEQAEVSGVDIDTRSDIYSLGVLLYELLAGSTPFDANELLKAGFDEMRRVIRETEPAKPSTRLTQMRTATPSKIQNPKSEIDRDLDWIVMKCLEKDRRRRYETANGLAADLKRHLSNEPVVARPPSAVYKFQKLVRRNKLVFAAAGLVATVLVLGVLVSTWQAVVATRARKAEFKQRMAAQDAQAHAVEQQRQAEAERQRAQELLTRAEWLVYAGKLLLAQTDFEAGNGGLALHYLDECQQNLRGWEHRYLRTRINAKQTLAGHSNEVSSVAFSPDSQRIVTGSLDQTAKVWDAATGLEVLALQGHELSVLTVAFSPDGQRIVTGAGERGLATKPGEAKVWNAGTGQELLALNGHLVSVLTVAFSPDGRRIATGAGDWGQGAKPGEVKVWDAARGEELLDIPVREGGVRSVAFSPDGRRLVTGSWYRTAKVWDAATGQEVFALEGHTHWATCAAFSPDGQHIVTGSDDRTAKVWDAATGQELRTLKEHAERVTSVAFSLDGKRIVTGSVDQTIKVWNVATGREAFTLKGHAGSVWSVASSPDGQRILTGSSDRTAKVWNAATGQEVPTLKGHWDSVSSIGFSPDGQRIATASTDGTAKVWDTVTGQEVLAFKTSKRMWGVAFSPDGQRILTGGDDRTAKVWDAATGQELLTLEHANVVSSVAFSPDGQRIVTGVGEWGRPDKQPGEARVWDAATGRELLTLKHSNVVWSVAFNPAGRRIVTGCGDSTARMWDAATGQEVLTLKGHTAAVQSVAFSPDGKRIVTGSRDQMAKVWDTTTGEEVLILKGHTGNVRTVTFSPDGQRIVTGSDDRTAKVWDAGTGQEVLALKGHTAMVWSVAFSPDGQRIVTGIAGAGATAKVWSAAPMP